MPKSNDSDLIVTCSCTRTTRICKSGQTGTPFVARTPIWKQRKQPYTDPITGPVGVGWYCGRAGHQQTGSRKVTQ